MKIRLEKNNDCEASVFPKGSRPVFILAGCFASLALLGWLDYLTGYELGFFVFYSVPVGLAGWYLGRWPGVAVALGATVTWWLADAFAGAKYSGRFSFWWNSTIHFLSFVINAVTIAKIKLELDKRQVMAAQFEATREALRAVAKLLPACPVCGKAHAPHQQNSAPELLEAARANADLGSALCAACRDARKTSPPRQIN